MAKLKGEPIKLIGSFTDNSNEAADPTEPVLVRIKDPFGNIELSGSAATREATGSFAYTHTFEKSGLYTYRFKSEDGVKETKTLEIVDDDTE